MLDIDIAYPEFVPNQILTDGQLNQLRTHLEQEDRSTRVRLTGMGIVCGFYIRKASTGTLGVEITGGYGVTSDGDLIEQCATTFYTHSQAYTDPDLDEEKKLRYLPWRSLGDPKQQLDIIELISDADMTKKETEAHRKDAKPFDTTATLTSTLAGRVLVLYLEHEPVDLNSCLVTSCDNKGRNINVHVRLLLVKKADITAAAQCAAAPAFFRVPRFRTTYFHTASEVNSAFTSIVTANVATVATNVKTLFTNFAAFLKMPQLLDLTSPSTISGSVSTSGIAQYRYDALLDYAAAYNEAAAAAYGMVTDCCPDGHFPRHLILGVLDGSPDAGTRHEFLPAASRNVMYGEIDRVRGLFKRLYTMVEDVTMTAHPAAVTIRPSHSAACVLGRRAVPFYFSAAASSWRPHARCTVDADWPWTNPAIAQSFTTDYDELNFFRIEGHVGKYPPAARHDLRDRRQDAGAEFNLLCSYLQDDRPAADGKKNTLFGLLKVDEQLQIAAREALSSWIIGKTDSLEPVEALAGWRKNQIAELLAASSDWIAFRKRRTLQCDAGSLDHDYQQARGELICAAARAEAILLRFKSDIERLADEQLVAAAVADTAEGAPFALSHALVMGVLAQPGDWTSEAEIRKVLEKLGPFDGMKAVRWTLVVAMTTLHRCMATLLSAATLPRHIWDFDFDLFAYLFRAAMAQSRELWTWARVIGLPVPGTPMDPMRPGEPTLTMAEGPAIAADWLGLHGCLLSRFATAAARYDAIWRKDYSLFDNLASVDGLEHLAGVSKGGTFILVCDDASSTGKVVADLSLEGSLPCCCHVDPNFCLPALANGDVRVVTVPPRNQLEKLLAKAKKAGTEVRLFDLVFAVGANDCDLNDPASNATLELMSATSEMGVKLTVDPKGPVILYQPGDKARAGMIDRFEYIVGFTGDCAPKAIGTVVVIYAAEPVVETDGAIKGILTYEGKFVPIGLVTITETGQTISEGEDGFLFEHLPEDDYTLVGSVAEQHLFSDPLPVHVIAGQTIENVELKLYKQGDTAPPPPPKGRMYVSVKDMKEQLLSGAKVTLLHDTDPPREAITGADGVAVIDGLPEGSYVVMAEKPGTVTQQLDAPLVLNKDESVRVDVTLRTQTATVPAATVETVATTRNTDVLTTAIDMRRTVQDRYASYALTLNRATRDPQVLTSQPYRMAATFMAKDVVDPAMTQSTLTTNYRRVATDLANAAKTATEAKQKAPYQAALMAATGAYFDRLAVASGGALAAQRADDVKWAVRTLKTAGVDPAAMQQMWNANGLTERAGVGSAEAIGGLITG